MIMKNKEILKDKSFQKFLKKKQTLTEATKQNYITSIRYYCIANHKPFHQIIKEQYNEQKSRIINGVIHEYNPDYSSIDDYQYELIQYLQKKGNKNSSILSHIRNVNVVLTGLGVKIPTLPDLPNDSSKWYVLTHEEIKYVLNIANTKYKAIILFMASTGMRRTDVSRLQIKDYMKATYEYHQCTELNDFLYSATDDMIGFFNYQPHKTRKHTIEHKVCNSPESNKSILFMLRERQKKLTSKNLKLSKEDYLFSSYYDDYKGIPDPKQYSIQFHHYNKKLIRERQRIITEKLENELISEDTYNQLLEEAPVFNAHALRKFFITQVALTCSNPRVISLLEGHSTLLRTDVNYVDTRSIDDLVKEEYLKVLPKLCFDDVNIDFTVLKRNKDLLKENKRQQELLNEQKRVNKQHTTLINDLRNKQDEYDRVLQKLLKDTRLDDLL